MLIFICQNLLTHTLKSYAFLHVQTYVIKHSLAKDTQIARTTMRSHTTYIRLHLRSLLEWLQIEIKQLQAENTKCNFSTGKAMEKLEPLGTADRNVK